MIRDKNTIQLVDFGVACVFDANIQGAAPNVNEGTTIAFQPPETWPSLFEDDEEGESEGSGHESEIKKKPAEEELPDVIKAKAADCWALGCTFYAMIFGRLPFEAPEGGIAAVIEVIKKKE